MIVKEVQDFFESKYFSSKNITYTVLCKLYFKNHKPFFSKYIHGFFTSNTFISNTKVKLAKHSAKAKQHSEAEFLTKMFK